MRLASGIGAALLMAWGLVAAPIVHQLVAHAHRDEPVLYKPRALRLKPLPASQQAPTHSHGAPGTPQREHGDGSLEHGRALLHRAGALPVAQRTAVAVALPSEVAPRAPRLSVWPRVEMPQGP